METAGLSSSVIVEDEYDFLKWLYALRVTDKVDVFDEYHQKWRIGTIKRTNCNPFSNMIAVWHLKSSYDLSKTNKNKKDLTGFQIYFDGFCTRADILILFSKKETKLTLSYLKDKINKLNTHTPIHYYLLNPLSNICRSRKYTLCTVCKLKCCTVCNIYKMSNKYFCSKCINNDDYNKLFNSILETIQCIKDPLIIKCITDYTIGYTLKCCNNDKLSKNRCNNTILIKNKFDFSKNMDISGKQIYKYLVQQENNTNYQVSMVDNYHIHQLFGKRIRVFCADCTSNKLKSCQYYDYIYDEKAKIWRDRHKYIRCNLKDAEYNFCFSHLKECIVCKKQELNNWYRFNSDKPYICKICANHFCEECGIYDGTICRNCDYTKCVTNIRDSVYDAIGYYVNIDIVDIITSYSIGYILECCSKICEYSISINTRTEFEKEINNQKNSNPNDCEYTWKYKDIIEWMKRLENGMYLKKYIHELQHHFKKNRINSQKLKRLNGYDLEAYGITKRAHRHKLLRNIKSLKLDIQREIFFLCGNTANIKYSYFCSKCTEEIKPKYRARNRNNIQQNIYYRNWLIYYGGGTMEFDDFVCNEELLTERPNLFRYKGVTGFGKKIRRQFKPHKAKKKRKRESLLGNKEDKQRNHQSKRQFNTKYYCKMLKQYI